ncbi:hypothetical protein ACKVEX_07785 [Rhodocyclaceae bacterium SMB388]
MTTAAQWRMGPIKIAGLGFEPRLRGQDDMIELRTSSRPSALPLRPGGYPQ